MHVYTYIYQKNGFFSIFACPSVCLIQLISDLCLSVCLGRIWTNFDIRSSLGYFYRLALPRDVVSVPVVPRGSASCYYTMHVEHCLININKKKLYQYFNNCYGCMNVCKYYTHASVIYNGRKL